MIFIGILLYRFVSDFGPKRSGKAPNGVTMGGNYIPRHPTVTSGPILGDICFVEKKTGKIDKNLENCIFLYFFLGFPGPPSP